MKEIQIITSKNVFYYITTTAEVDFIQRIVPD